MIDGLGVALITPFNEDLSIDYISLANLIEHVISGGCDYIVALGTTAETPTLSHIEKQAISRFICERVKKRVPLVIGIGGNSTMGVVEEIRNSDLEGYDAVLSVTPYYNKPTQEGLFKHFLTISENSKLPVVLYNVPGRTGVNLSEETTIKLANESKNIIGIKEASGKIEQCLEILKRAPEGFRLISGNDSDTAILIENGAAGVISVVANAFPVEMKKLVTLSSCQNHNEATLLQTSLKPIITRLFEEGSPAGIKSVLSYLGISKNILRLPLTPVGSTTENVLKIESDSLLRLNR